MNLSQNVDLTSVRRIRKMDNPTLSNITIYEMIDLIIEFDGLSRRLGITMSGLMTLLVLYKEFNTTGNGLNCAQISKQLRYEGNNIFNIQNRVTKYLRMGYIDIFGTGVNHSRLFSPSKLIVDMLDKHYSKL